MNIEISTERLDADIKKLDENVISLIEAKNQVYRCLAQLNSMWDGMAKLTFNNQVTKDQHVLTELISNLNNLVECMQYAKSEYNRCNEDVNSKIASIRLSNDT